MNSSWPPPRAMKLFRSGTPASASLDASYCPASPSPSTSSSSTSSSENARLLQQKGFAVSVDGFGSELSFITAAGDEEQLQAFTRAGHGAGKATAVLAPLAPSDFSAPDADLGDSESSDETNDEEEPTVSTTLMRHKQSSGQKTRGKGLGVSLSMNTSGVAFSISPKLGGERPGGIAHNQASAAADRRVLFSAVRTWPKVADQAPPAPHSTPPANGCVRRNPPTRAASCRRLITPINAAGPPQSAPPFGTWHHYSSLRRPRRPHSTSSATAIQMATTSLSSEAAPAPGGADVFLDDSGGDSTTPRDYSSETTPSTVLTPASNSRNPMHRLKKQYSFGAASASTIVHAQSAAAFSHQALRSLDSMQRFAIMSSSIDDNNSAGGPFQPAHFFDDGNNFELDSINEFGDIGGKLSFEKIYVSLNF